MNCSKNDNYESSGSQKCLNETTIKWIIFVVCNSFFLADNRMFCLFASLTSVMFIIITFDTNAKCYFCRCANKTIKCKWNVITTLEYLRRSNTLEMGFAFQIIRSILTVQPKNVYNKFSQSLALFLFRSLLISLSPCVCLCRKEEKKKRCKISRLASAAAATAASKSQNINSINPTFSDKSSFYFIFWIKLNCIKWWKDDPLLVFGCKCVDVSLCCVKIRYFQDEMEKKTTNETNREKKVEKKTFGVYIDCTFFFICVFHHEWLCLKFYRSF